MLFPDFEGFAQVNRQDIAYTLLSASQYRKDALQNMEEQKFGEAIANFTAAIKVDPGNSTDYNNRGSARQILLNNAGVTEEKQYKGVLNDYTEAIELDPNTPVSYFQRGALKSKIGLRHEAVIDLEKALKIFQAIGSEKHISEVQEKIRELKQQSQ